MKDENVYVWCVLISAAIIIVWVLSNSFEKQSVTVKKHRPENKYSNIHLISVVYGGGLGNCIWEYMSLLAILRKHENEFNLIGYVPEELKYKLMDVFETINILEIGELPSICFRNETRRTLQLNETFNAKDIFNDDKYCVILGIYSARYKYVIEYGIKNIKNELRFQRKHTKEAYDTLIKIRDKFYLTSNDVTYVGVHYRGTDYVDFLRRNYNSSFTGPPDYRYYIKIMDYFNYTFGNVIFILITVDLEWLEENLPFLENRYNLIVNPNNNDTVKDLVLLSSCNHSIINYGTFGVTSALFAGGTTFVYDLGLPLDHRGPTVAAGIANILPHWHLMN